MLNWKMTVMSMNMDQNFKGMCYLCREKGHRKQNCPQKTGKSKENKTKLKYDCSNGDKKGCK